MALNTDTALTFYKKQIKSGKVEVKAVDYGSFSCGAFVSDLYNKNKYNSDKDSAIVRIKKPGNAKKILEFWTERVKDIGIDAEYFGLENNKHIILYKIPNTESKVTRLLHFTILRYGWAKPYSDLVKLLFLLSQRVDDYKDPKYFWEKFFFYHNYLQNDVTYSSTFGLLVKNERRLISYEELLKVMDVNFELDKFDSINTRFNKCGRKITMAKEDIHNINKK